MKISKILLFSLIGLFLLIFIVVIVKQTNQKIISVSLVSEKMEIKYTDSESIKIFQNAIRTAKKLPGAVDVPPPNYRMTVKYDNSEVVKYSLYINMKSKNGNLIKESDSEKMLKIKEQYVKELKDLLGKEKKE